MDILVSLTIFVLLKSAAICSIEYDCIHSGDNFNLLAISTRVWLIRGSSNAVRAWDRTTWGSRKGSLFTVFDRVSWLWADEFNVVIIVLYYHIFHKKQIFHEIEWMDYYDYFLFCKFFSGFYTWYRIASIILMVCASISLGILASTITYISPIFPPLVRHFPDILNLVPGFVPFFTLRVRLFP